MSTGPPTPPPISATEIQDATRTVVPPLPAASTSTPVVAAPQAPRQDMYTQLFPQIASLASEKNFVQLIRAAEGCDISAEERQPSRFLLTAPLVLAYLTIDDLPPALAALNRLPSPLPSTPLVKQLYALLASTSERKYANVYTRAQGLVELVGKPDFFDTSLGALLGVMVHTFLEEFRNRTFNLLVKAYTSLPLPLAQVYLGLPADEVLSVSANNGWTFDAANQVLTPVPPQKAATSNGFSPFSSLATFDLVANSVAKLET
ncbi:COP9 signalosome [Mycena maculata]|uniref:COP9 signalosome n=1 Tax=Mycena maculata TaxID=230809 RepID=A0AAD7ISH5_9AGAR|nr:COP9 signalosome [Mycena maculata]